jgi:hypothetical protein
MFFVAFSVHVRKSTFPFIVLTIANLLIWGTLYLFLSSTVTHYSIGNEHHDQDSILCPIFKILQSIQNNYPESAAHIGSS